MPTLQLHWNIKHKNIFKKPNILEMKSIPKLMVPFMIEDQLQWLQWRIIIRLISSSPIDFLFGDLCYAFTSCRKNSTDRGCNAHTVIFTLLFHRGLWIGTANESGPNASIILQTFVLIGLMLVSGARVEDDIFNVQFYCLSFLTNVHSSNLWARKVSDFYQLLQCI